MAKQIALNQLFQGQTGRIGNYVLRIINGLTYISVRPKKRTHSSPKQIQQMSRFQLAIKWANAHKHDPEFVLAAQQTKANGINSYNLAIKKALSDPSILAPLTMTTPQSNFTTTTSVTTNYNQPTTNYKTPSLKTLLCTLIILITTTISSYARPHNTSPESAYISIPSPSLITLTTALFAPSLSQSNNNTSHIFFKSPPLATSNNYTTFAKKYTHIYIRYSRSWPKNKSNGYRNSRNSL